MYMHEYIMSVYILQDKDYKQTRPYKKDVKTMSCQLLLSPEHYSPLSRFPWPSRKALVPVYIPN
jgi:hypothetical protein